MFLHGSWSHIIGNMWYLWIFGDNVEDRVGHGRFIVFYLLCGIAAALGQVAVDPNSTLPTIGASGAIAGVMGAYFVLYPRSRVLTLIPLIIFWEVIELPAIVLLGFWFLMQLFSAGAIAVTASTQGGGVAFAAHVAGLPDRDGRHLSLQEAAGEHLGQRELVHHGLPRSHEGPKVTKSSLSFVSFVFFVSWSSRFRAFDGPSAPRVDQLEEQILGALVGGGDLERRERLFFRLGVLAGLQIALGEIGDRGRAIDRLQREDRAELARRDLRVVALDGELAEHRVRFDVVRVDARNPVVDRPQHCRILDPGKLQLRRQPTRRTDVVEVDGDERLQLRDRAGRVLLLDRDRRDQRVRAILADRPL